MTTTLPMTSGDLFLADSGLETDLIFNQGFDLPEFASFTLLRDDSGRAALSRYFAQHLEVAREYDTGIVLETPTWRASHEWGQRLGVDDTELAEANRQAVALVRGAADEAMLQRPAVVSGNIGPRGDAYRPEQTMTGAQAREYHSAQVEWLVEGDADVITAMTLTHVGEAVGIALAAREHDVPVVLSFTTETDGLLPDGTPLADAITATDDATEAYAAYYMVNCAHPTHFAHVLDADEDAFARVRGVRANASRMSHAELDEAEELDDGNPDELAAQYADLKGALPHLSVFGGCCGTDVRHVAAAARTLT